MLEKTRILVSACLIGMNCRYDGGGKLLPEMEELMGVAELIPVCPEIYGGLPTPRTPSERVGACVRMKTGEDVTEAFQRGAEEALGLALRFGVKTALLKERSPSCGSGEIYDGSFSGGKKPGDGMTAGLLKRNGITVYGESRIRELINGLKEG